MPHVTVPDVPVLESFSAAAAQTNFPFGFTFYDLDDIKVTQQGSTLVRIANYNITPNLGTDGGFEGGTVVLLNGATSGDTITISLNLPIARTTDFPTVGPFNIAQLNTQLDRNVSMIQKALLDIELNGVNTVQNGAKIANYTITANDANTVLTFNTTAGNITVNLPVAPQIQNGFTVLLTHVAGDNYIEIVPGGGQNINGVAFHRLQGHYTSARLIFTGTGWLANYFTSPSPQSVKLRNVGSVDMGTHQLLAGNNILSIQADPLNTEATSLLRLTVDGTTVAEMGADGFRAPGPVGSESHLLFVDRTRRIVRMSKSGASQSDVVDSQYNELTIDTLGGSGLVCGINLLTDAAGATGIAFGDTTDARRGLLSYDNTDDTMRFFVGMATVEGLAISPTNVVINEDGLDRDFRVESDTNPSMLFMNAGLNTFGVGGGAPLARLHVFDTPLGSTAYANVSMAVEADKAEMGMQLTGRATGVAKYSFGDDSPAADRAMLRFSFPTGILSLASDGQVRITDDSLIQISAQFSPVIGAALGKANTLNTRTDGWCQIPFVIGTPTGTPSGPSAVSGMVPMVWNSTGNTLHVYSGGAWRTV